ncbi:hypothetical protein Tco_0664048 [Tanacetum coccineum]
MPLIERQLVRNLQHISEVLYAQVVEDHWEKHKEAATSYADLRANVESYYEENVDHKDQTMMCRFGVGVDTAYPMGWIRRIEVSWSRDPPRLHLPKSSHTIVFGYGVNRVLLDMTY